MLRLQKLFHSKIAPWYLDPVLFSGTMRINLDPLNFSHGPWILESSLFGARGGGYFCVLSLLDWFFYLLNFHGNFFSAYIINWVILTPAWTRKIQEFSKDDPFFYPLKLVSSKVGAFWQKFNFAFFVLDRSGVVFRNTAN